MGPDTVPVSHGQVYGRVGRAFTQVTISCDSDNGETVYNGYHSQFTLTWTVEKKNWFLFHCAFLSFKAFLGASVILPDTVPTKSFCSLIVGSVKAWMNCSPGFVKNTKLVLIDLITDKLTGFTFAKSSWIFWRFDWFLTSYSLIVGSVKAWMNCSPGFVKNTKLVLIDLITDKLTGFTFAKSSWIFWRFDWFLASYFIKRRVPPAHHETLQEKWSCLKQNIAKYVMWLRRFSWP